MQKKTIDKIIRKKMLDWLDTLPIDLANKVKSNILVSGGSIASMFLKEPINDFDIYIQDIEVLKELVDFYTRPLNINYLDGRLKDIYLQDFMKDRDQFTLEEDLAERTIFLKSLHFDQIKIDINGAGKRFEIPGIEKIEDDIFKVLFLSQNAISLTNDVQIVTRFSGKQEDIHKNFDYIHATNYWTWEDGIITNIEAVESLLTKQLIYQGSLYPLTSVIRMKKFINRGWKISAGEILKMLFQVSDLDLRDPIILEEQLIGVDIAYFSTLIKLLNGVPPEKWTSKFLMESIDKVFNKLDI